MENFERKNAHLDHLITALEVRGKASPSAHNNVIAENETAFEMGDFDEPRPTLGSEEQLGFIVRARRDALAGKLSAGDALDRLSRLERTLDERMGRIQALVTFGIAVALLGLAVSAMHFVTR